MIRFDDICAEIEGLEAEQLARWIARGWVRPQTGGENGDDGEPVFSDVDVARVRLIRECRVELEIAADAMPVVLSLLDQVHGLRRELAVLADAVSGQPDEVRRDIMARAAKGMNWRDG